MKRILPALALLAACSGRPPVGEPATVTLFGPAARLEEWHALVAENRHLHPAGNGPCGLEELFRTLEDGSKPLTGPRLDAFGGLMEETIVAASGPAFGGPGRLALALRRPGAEPKEAVMLEVPALKPGETEREFAASECRAQYLTPVQKGVAGLSSGRVRVSRREGRRFDFEVFLVLRPADSPASFERLQIVTRVEASVSQ